jgi:glycosyltransferase involved in cell wall biosynthesis
MKADGRSIENVGLHATLTRLQTPFSAMVEQQLFRRAARMTAVAKSVVHEMQEYGISAERVQILGNGTDAAFFAPDDRPRPARPTFLYAGRLAHRKGLFDFVEAARLLTKSNPDVRVQLAGSGPLEAALRAKVAEHRLEGSVEFLGHVGTRDALREAYRSATAYVQPSHYEGLPTSLLEAMSAGAACIATNVSGHPDVIQSGVNGLLVEAQQPEALAAAMQRIASNPTEAMAFGRAARATILEQFTWPHLTRAYLDVYESALTGAQPHPTVLHPAVPR